MASLNAFEVIAIVKFRPSMAAYWHKWRRGLLFAQQSLGMTFFSEVDLEMKEKNQRLRISKASRRGFYGMFFVSLGLLFCFGVSLGVATSAKANSAEAKAVVTPSRLLVFGGKTLPPTLRTVGLYSSRGSLVGNMVRVPETNSVYLASRHVLEALGSDDKALNLINYGVFDVYDKSGVLLDISVLVSKKRLINLPYQSQIPMRFLLKESYFPLPQVGKLWASRQLGASRNAADTDLIFDQITTGLVSEVSDNLRTFLLSEPIEKNTTPGGSGSIVWILDDGQNWKFAGVVECLQYSSRQSAPGVRAITASTLVDAALVPTTVADIIRNPIPLDPLCQPIGRRRGAGAD